MLLLILAAALMLPPPTQAFQHLASGMQQEQRLKVVHETINDLQSQEPIIFQRRRLNLPTTRLPTSADLHDNYNYHKQVSIQSHLLRSFGFTKEDGVEATHAPDSQLTIGFHRAARDLAIYYLNMDSMQNTSTMMFHVNTNGVTAAGMAEINNEEHPLSSSTHSRHLYHLPGVTDHPTANRPSPLEQSSLRRQLALTDMLMESDNANTFLDRKLLNKRTLRNIECGSYTPESVCKGLETTWELKNKIVDKTNDVVDKGTDMVNKGIDAVDKGIDKAKDTADALSNVLGLGDNGRGNYKNECVSPVSKKNKEGFIKVDVETTCKLEPISVYQVIPADVDTVVEDATTYTGEKCTCESCIYKAGGVPHDDIGRVDQKWCKCAQTGTNLGLDVENYALLGPVCTEYPTVGMDSSCQINNNNNTFPKVINCKFVVVLFRGVDVTLETEIRLGFGTAGEDNALAADMYMGIATSKLPRGCWGADTVMEILPDPSDQGNGNNNRLFLVGECIFDVFLMYF